MADEPRRRVSERLAAQRDYDREIIEAWFQGQGATVVTTFMAIAALVVIFVVAGDSPLLALVLVAVLAVALWRMRGQD